MKSEAKKKSEKKWRKTHRKHFNELMREPSRKYQEKRREEYKKNGLCVKCGKIKDLNISLCSKCKKRKSKIDKERYARRKVNHQCTKCQRLLDKDYIFVYCSKCLKKSRNQVKHGTKLTID